MVVHPYLVALSIALESALQSLNQCSTLPLNSYVIPSQLINLLCFSFGNTLVNMSAKFSSVAQY